MKKHSERQLHLWLAWLHEEWNRPARSDHYLMQLACEVRRVPHFLSDKGKPESVQPDQFKLTFTTHEVKAPVDIDIPGFPKRLTKEDVVRLNRDMRLIQIKRGSHQ